MLVALVGLVVSDSTDAGPAIFAAGMGSAVFGVIVPSSAPSSSTSASAADQRRIRSNGNRPEHPDLFVGIACGRPPSRAAVTVRPCMG